MSQANSVRTNLRVARIPEVQFRASFGRAHTFVLNRAVFAGGGLHFWFGGFSFAIRSAWPANWFATDAVYVDNIGGMYYLCDPLHPEVRLALSVADTDSLAAAPEADESNPEPVADSGFENDESVSPAPNSIRRGQTTAQVVAVLGSPTTVINLGARRIYVYPEMRLTFIAGRLRNVR